MSVKNFIKVANYFSKKYNITKQASGIGDNFEIQEGVSSSTGPDFTDPSFIEAMEKFILAVRALQNYLIKEDVYVASSFSGSKEYEILGNKIISKIIRQKLDFDADVARTSCDYMVNSLLELQKLLIFHNPVLGLSGLRRQQSNLSNLPSLIRKALEASENLYNEFSKHQVESTAISLREGTQFDQGTPKQMDRVIERKQREFEESIFGKDEGDEGGEEFRVRPRVDPDKIYRR